MATVVGVEQPDDQGAALRRIKTVATATLAAAAATYVGIGFVPGDSVYIAAVKATAEAATVGGLADWFAVVALFRRPLGLPIPHTALLPSNKDRIGGNLGRFVQDHFIDPDDLSSKVAGADLPGYLAEWLNTPANARMLADQAAALLPGWLASLDDGVLKEHLKAEVRSLVADVDLVATADDVLMSLLNRGEHLAMVDDVTDMALTWIQDEKPGIEKQINAKVVAWLASWIEGWVIKALGIDAKYLANGWISQGIAGHIADGIVHEFVGKLKEARDPSAQLRFKVHTVVLEHVQKLKASETWAARLEGIRSDVVGHRDFDRHFDEIWGMLRGRLVEALERSREDIACMAADQVARLAEALRRDEALRDRVNGHIKSLVRDSA